jgi:hypothetical protein
MEEPNIIRVDCDVCEHRREIAKDNITIVHNLTFDTYSYTYYCVKCGSRQVHSFHDGWIKTMLSEGWNYMSFKMPYLSDHPGGPPINIDDVNEFVKSLNSHDHLAAYA